MYPVSDDFLHAVQENTRKYYWTGKITTKNGVVYDFKGKEIVRLCKERIMRNGIVP